MEKNNRKPMKFAYVPKEMLEELLKKSEAYDELMEEKKACESDEPCCSYCGTPASQTEDEILVANEDKTSHICLECVENISNGENLEEDLDENQEENSSNCEICGLGCGGVKANEEEMPEELKELVNKLKASGIGDVQVTRIPRPMGIGIEALKSLDPRMMPMHEMPIDRKMSKDVIADIVKSIMDKDKVVARGPKEPKDIIGEIFQDIIDRGAAQKRDEMHIMPLMGKPLNFKNEKELEDLLKSIGKGISIDPLPKQAKKK